MAVVLITFTGCAKKIIISSTPSPKISPPKPEKILPTHKQLSPRALASLQLTQQGQTLLEKGKPDDAIRILERAIRIHSGTGQNYYYLSEAWIVKRDATQANEFHRLAEIYLKKDAEWSARLNQQRIRIQNLQKNRKAIHSLSTQKNPT